MTKLPFKKNKKLKNLPVLKSFLPSFTLSLPHILPSLYCLDPSRLLPHVYFSTQFPRHWQMWTKEAFCTTLTYLNHFFLPFTLFLHGTLCFFFTLCCFCVWSLPTFLYFCLLLILSDRAGRTECFSLPFATLSLTFFCVLQIQHIPLPCSYVFRDTFFFLSRNLLITVTHTLQSQVSPVLL